MAVREPNHLILWKDLNLFWGRNALSIREHQHPTIQWGIGVEGEFLWKNAQGQWILFWPKTSIPPLFRKDGMNFTKPSLTYF